MADKVSLDDAFASFDETDEFFLVLSGRLHLALPDATVTLGPGEVLTVPRGVSHRPRADPGTRTMSAST
jgi:mannose-6-phosphate isomerase-like protein (cupin superfamily)